MSISFDRIADRYDATRGFPSDVGERVAAALAHEAALTPGARLLEIGVGTGRIALPVAAYVSDMCYVGVDISRDMMATLRHKDRSGAIALLQADATQLPLADRSFDAALIVHVLHLVSDAEDTLAEVWRVLRPRGVLLHGYNTYDTAPALEALRTTRWIEFVEEGGGTVRTRRRSAHVNDQIAAFFGQPRSATLATWAQSMTPRSVLENLRSRSNSATWDIPAPIFDVALARTDAWAREQFADLDQPINGTASFKLDIFER